MWMHGNSLPSADEQLKSQLSKMFIMIDLVSANTALRKVGEPSLNSVRLVGDICIVSGAHVTHWRTYFGFSRSGGTLL